MEASVKSRQQRAMRTMFIAELGINHNGDLGRAKLLTASARLAGFDAVKVQLFNPDLMFRRGSVVDTRIADLRQARVTSALLLPLIETAIELGLKVGATVCDCDPETLRLAEYCEFVKVGSYELNCLEIVAAAAKLGKPLILSTGMATTEEVNAAITVASQHTGDIAVLHCVSLYPCPVNQANLSRIHSPSYSLGSRRLAAGYSDHTASPEVVKRAVQVFSARVVEMHVDAPDGLGFESGEHCWSFEAAQKTIEECRMDGDSGAKETRPDHDERAWRRDPSDGMRPMKT